MQQETVEKAKVAGCRAQERRRCSRRRLRRHKRYRCGASTRGLRRTTISASDKAAGADGRAEDEGVSAREEGDGG